jgi:hypothetical protein
MKANQPSQVQRVDQNVRLIPMQEINIPNDSFRQAVAKQNEENIKPLLNIINEDGRQYLLIEFRAILH